MMIEMIDRGTTRLYNPERQSKYENIPIFPDQQWGKTESTINDAVQSEKPATNRLDEPPNPNNNSSP